MAKDFLTDKEMNALETAGKVKSFSSNDSAPEFLSNEEMGKLEKAGRAKDWAPKQVDIKKSAQAALEGFGNAASLGYGAQLQAMAEPAITKALDLVTGKKVYETLPSYQERKDENLKRQKELAKDSPVAYGAGSIAGALATGFGTSALLPVKGASVLARTAKASSIGGLTGGLANPGDEEGKAGDLQLKERVNNALTGAAFSGGAQFIGEAVARVGQALKASPETLKQYAEGKAAKSLAPTKADIKRNLEDGKFFQIGRSLLDNKIVAPGKSVADIDVAVNALKQEKGQVIGNIIDEVESTLTQPAVVSKLTPDQKKAVAETVFRPKQFAKEMKLQFTKELKGRAGSTAILSKVGPVLDDIAEAGNQVGIKETLLIKESVDDLVHYSKSIQDMAPAQQHLVKIRNAIRDKMNAKVNVVDQILGKEASNRLIQANKEYGAIAEGARIVKGAVAAQNANAILGLRDVGIGSAAGLAGAAQGISEGDPEKALKQAVVGFALGAGGTKLARQYGTPLLATGADKLGSALASGRESLKLAAQGAPAMLRVPAKGLANVVSEGSKGGIPAAIGNIQVQKKYQFQEAPAFSPDEILQDPGLIKLLQENPRLIENIQNPQLKAELLKRIDRAPSGSAIERRMKEKSGRR